MLILFCALSSCAYPEKLTQNNRVFSSSFEAESDFTGFYVVPQGEYDSSHELSSDNVYEGLLSHKAWIIKARDTDNDALLYKPHRAYPTIQMYKSNQGSFVTPCLVSLKVYLDLTLADKPSGSTDDWFSFATLSPDASDMWTRTILVNTAPDGYVRLVHVPEQGRQEYVFQAESSNDPEGALLFPYRQWVSFDIYIDLDDKNGYAKVWQDGVLVSHAYIKGGKGLLEQAHFGLYASAAVASGTVYNDALLIREVNGEEQAMSLLKEK